MDFGLRDKVVVVTGASKGIGFACAQAFAREGARVALVSRSRANLDAALAGIGDCAHRPAVFVADLRDAAQALRMVEARRVDAGPDRRADQLRRCREALSARRARRPGVARRDGRQVLQLHPSAGRDRQADGRARARAIVNIIGMGGKVGRPVHVPGGAANAALMLATTGLAAAYGPKGVRVNAINPGGTMTGRVQEGLQAEARMSGLGARARSSRAREARIPLRRLGTPEEVAQVALFLASTQASYVTGAIVPMDGGAASVISSGTCRGKSADAGVPCPRRPPAVGATLHPVPDAATPDRRS